MQGKQEIPFFSILFGLHSNEDQIRMKAVKYCAKQNIYRTLKPQTKDRQIKPFCFGLRFN